MEWGLFPKDWGGFHIHSIWNTLSFHPFHTHSIWTTLSFHMDSTWIPHHPDNDLDMRMGRRHRDEGMWGQGAGARCGDEGMRGWGEGAWQGGIRLCTTPFVSTPPPLSFPMSLVYTIL